MKKLIFGFIATILFANLNYGQTIDPSNPKNKFDYIGVKHNEGLNSFINNYHNINNLEINKILNFEALLNSNTLFLGNDKSLKQFNSNFTNDSSLKEYFKALNSTNPDYIKALSIIKFKGSYEFNSFYLKIINKINDINFINIKTLEDYLLQIKTLEDEIINSSISENEKELLLSSSSVSRHSATYWFNVFDSQNNWNPNNLNSSKQIIKIDVAGGVAGGVVGAVVGGTVTIVGIGAIPGWAAGAVTGALGGSISQAVIELWEWMFG